MNLSRFSPILRLPIAQRATQKLLLQLEPELAHDSTLLALRSRAVPPQVDPDDSCLSITLAGLVLKNPVGMAAGFNKDAEMGLGLSRIGFGFEEVGTITPRPQKGNDKPRIFRLSGAGAIINRMGFNNVGHNVAYDRLQSRERSNVVGVNVGANKDSADFVGDYVAGVRRFSDVASYITINVSSPNTPGLRNLQADQALKRLLDATLSERDRLTKRVPIFLKLAPDLEEAELDKIAAVVLSSNLDGLIVSNTTLSRDEVSGLPGADTPGGLSGKPLFNLSTRKLAQVRQRVGSLPIIGVGGIHSPESAVAKFEAGADAIQLYSALVFGGLDLLDRIKRGLAAAVRSRGLKSVSELTGHTTAEWASGKASL